MFNYNTNYLLAHNFVFRWGEIKMTSDRDRRVRREQHTETIYMYLISHVC